MYNESVREHISHIGGEKMDTPLEPSLGVVTKQDNDISQC